MAEMIVAELVLSGIIKVAMNKLHGDNAVQQNVEATRAEVMRMSGVVSSLRQETEDLRQNIAQLTNATALEACLRRKNHMLEAMTGVREDVRRSALDISLMVQTILEHTSIESLCIEVSRMLPDEDDSEEFFKSSHKVHFARMQTSHEIVRQVLTMETQDDLFSGVKHPTEDRMSVYVSAWAPAEKELSKLVEATGALYQLSQTLCDVIVDPRGMYVTAIGDGNIARSQTALCHNSSTVLLSYEWPSPSQLGSFGQIVREASAGSREAADQLTAALERRGVRQQTKNVYLIGQTGEGKSTLANSFTGTNNFLVSYAGTGTYDISGCLVQRGGSLDMDKQVLVWDTPGMNDQDGLDQMFENKLYGHLTREQTVSTILIVSKDGSRFPGTLKDMIRVYKKAFGESFLSCVAVVIGVRLEDTRPEELRAKRRMWKQRISKEIGHKLPPERIYFYDARSSAEQVELQRLVRLISESEIYLTGTGNTIYQGLLDLKTEKNQLAKERKKTQMRLASKEILEGLKEEVLLHPRIKFIYNENDVRVKLLHSVRSSMRSLLSNGKRKFLQGGLAVAAAGALGVNSTPRTSRVDEAAEQKEKNGRDGPRKKEVRFTYGGLKAKELMQSVGHPLMGVGDKDRFNIMMVRARRKQLVLTKMESGTVGEDNQRVQVANYMIMDIDDNLNGEIYSRIEAIIKGLISDRHIAEPIIEEIENARSVRASSTSSATMSTLSLDVGDPSASGGVGGMSRLG